MLKIYVFFLIFFFLNAVYSENIINNKTIKFVFGSCSNQNKSMPHWNYINSYKPDYLVLLGDNVYGDFTNADATNLQNAYKVLDLLPLQYTNLQLHCSRYLFCIYLLCILYSLIFL